MKISRAFSLAEISIVILIVGVLVAGMTEGSKLFKKSKLRTARAMTKASYAVSVEDMILWLDATAEGSMVNASSSTIVEDGNTVQTWNDVNPQVITKYSFTQATDARRPTYEDNGINGLPSLYFDADVNNANGKALHPSTSFVFPTNEISVFLVMRPIGTPIAEGFIIESQATAGTKRFYISMYSDSKTRLYAGGYGQFDATAVVLNNNYITSAVVTSSAGTLYRNGALQYSGGWAHSAFIPDVFSIGSAYTNDLVKNFDGYVSEIIMYSRALETEERKEIEKYLGKKYGIQVS